MPDLDMIVDASVKIVVMGSGLVNFFTFADDYPLPAVSGLLATGLSFGSLLDDNVAGFFMPISSAIGAYTFYVASKLGLPKSMVSSSLMMGGSLYLLFS